MNALTASNSSPQGMFGLPTKPISSDVMPRSRGGTMGNAEVKRAQPEKNSKSSGEWGKSGFQTSDTVSAQQKIPAK